MSTVGTYTFENLRKYIPSMTPPVFYRMPTVARREIAQFDVIHIHDHRTRHRHRLHYAIKHGVPLLQARGSRRIQVYADEAVVDCSGRRR